MLLSRVGGAGGPFHGDFLNGVGLQRESDLSERCKFEIKI